MTSDIRAVHYFGSHWPLTFWSSFTVADVEADFRQIRADGFNTVILLLPTRMFNSVESPVQKFYAARLRHCLAMAETVGIKVMLRLGYPHDMAPENLSLAPRHTYKYSIMLHSEDHIYALHLDHLNYVKSLIDGNAGILMVFLSWEDMWGLFKHYPLLDLARRTRLSKALRFTEYLCATLSPELQAVFAVPGRGAVPVPQRTDPLFAVYKAFYDHYVHEKFIKPAQAIFGNLGYEQRVDGQLIHDVYGGTRWIPFGSNPTADIVSVSYWAPFMGQKNAGETIDAKTALNGLKRIDSQVRQRSGRNHFIDQFNFVNGTAEFTATSAKIGRDELVAFLDAALPYIAEHTLGYGLWAYRDYRENYIVNGTFERHSFNWTISGAARIAGTGPCWLAVNGTCELKTKVFFNGPLMKFDGSYGPFKLTFTLRSPLTAADVERGPSVVITFLGKQYPMTLQPGVLEQSCSIGFGYAGHTEMNCGLTIAIAMAGDRTIMLRDIQFYNHILSNGLYTYDNVSRPAMDRIREFNLSRTAGA